MAHGYFQIPTKKSSIAKAALTAPDGHFEPLRMFFGLWSVAPSCIDDVLVATRDWREMLQMLDSVFDALQKAHLTLRWSKCEFMKEEVKYLRLILSAAGVKRDVRKLAATTELPMPTHMN